MKYSVTATMTIEFCSDVGEPTDEAVIEMINDSLSFDSNFDWVDVYDVRMIPFK